MKRLLYIISTVIITYYITGCNDYNLFDESKDQIAGIDYPTTEKGDGYSITYKFKESTVVYDDSSIRYLHHIEGDTILYFDVNTPSELLPSVGTVMSAPITDVTPFGLGNKVLSTTSDGRYLRCVTTVAPLDEIFEQLSFEYETEDISCLVDNMEVFDVENDEWGRLKTSGMGSRTDKGIISISMDFPSFEKKGISLNGKVQITGKFHVEGDIDNGTFDFYFEPAITIKASCGAKLEYKKNLWQDINEYKYPFFRTPKTDIGVIPIGPIVLRPYIAAEGYFDFNASGSVLLDFEQRLSFKGGYSQANGGYMNNTSLSPSDAIKDLSVNGNVGLKLKGAFDVGIGVYVKNVAAEIDPYFSVGVGVDFREEVLKTNTAVDCKLNFDANAGMDAKFVIDFLGKLRLMPKVNIADFNLFHYEWPLIPIYEKESLVIASAGSFGNFDGNYIITGALLGKFWPLTPAVNVYDIDHKLIQRIKIGEPITCSSDYFVRFKLTGLTEGDYYVRPCIIYQGFDGNDISCEIDEEYKITGETSVEILGIRQTGCSPKEHDCEDGCGAHFDISFSYDVDIQVLGGANCVECGYCVTYIHGKRLYYSVPNSDGVHTVSNSVLFGGVVNPTFTIYPYVKYSTGDIVFGEPYTTQFTGASSGKPKALRPLEDSKRNTPFPHPRP